MTRTLILGAGFGGIQAAVDLEHLLHSTPEQEILLVSDQNYFMFTPLLPQIVSSYIDPRHIVQTVRDIRNHRKYRFRRDTVTSIDVNRRQVETSSGPIDYDYLIFALGSQTEYFNIPGALENSIDFKSLEDGVALRDRVLDICEHADHTLDPAERKRLLTFAIVGGGYTGVELITEMRDFLFRYVAGRYRGIPREEIRLVLVEATPNILGGFDPLLRPHALKRLNAEGIELRTGTPVTRVFDGALELKGGEILEAGTIIWTAGVRAHPLAESLPGPHDRIGRARVNEYLQLEGHPEVFVIGDSSSSALAPDAPRVAPVAIGQATIAAHNIVHLERNQPLESYTYVSQGMLVSLGMNDAVVSILGIRLHGFVAWLFWNAVHLFKLVGFKKQIQVALDWSLGNIFPRDAAIIRQPRNCKFCDSCRGGSSDSAAVRPSRKSAAV
jgi:NADH:ubiquinone reductase (H+-translocating)